MKQRKVWRYSCDFCKKSGCGKGAMVRHETHCTLNPARECRMCALGGTEGPLATESMDDLVAARGRGIGALRALAGGCPGCMLAAIRQHQARAFPEVHPRPRLMPRGIVDRMMAYHAELAKVDADDEFDFDKEGKTWVAEAVTNSQDEHRQACGGPFS